MIDVLAQPVGAEHEPAGTERTLVQALDCERVVRRLGRNCQREVIHVGAIAFAGRAVHSPSRSNAIRFSFCCRQTGTDRPAVSSRGGLASPCPAPVPMIPTTRPRSSCPWTAPPSAAAERCLAPGM